MKNWKAKKIQRHVNSVIRALNKNIERDELWLGRFYAHQVYCYFTPSEDGSYIYGRFLIEFVDRKSGKSMTHWFRREDFAYGAYKVWCVMNDFIVEYINVWAENPRPSRDNVWDYKKENK